MLKKHRLTGGLHRFSPSKCGPLVKGRSLTIDIGAQSERKASMPRSLLRDGFGSRLSPKDTVLAVAQRRKQIGVHSSARRQLKAPSNSDRLLPRYVAWRVSSYLWVGDRWSRYTLAVLMAFAFIYGGDSCFLNKPTHTPNQVRIWHNGKACGSGSGSGLWQFNSTKTPP